jgi:hypothetical protein
MGFIFMKVLIIVKIKPTNMKIYKGFQLQPCHKQAFKFTSPNKKRKTSSRSHHFFKLTLTFQEI